MPRLFEFEITAKSHLRLVAPDSMSDDDLAALVREKARELIERAHPEIEWLHPGIAVSISEASQDRAALRVSDNRKKITDSEVLWLGEGGS